MNKTGNTNSLVPLHALYVGGRIKKIVYAYQGHANRQ